MALLARVGLGLPKAARAHGHVAVALLGLALAAPVPAADRTELAQAAPAPDLPSLGAGGYDPLVPRGRAAGEPDTDVPRYDPQDEFMGLPRTPGYQTVFYQCTYCHSAQIIMQQRLPRQRWDYLIDWMIAEQGMPEPAPEQRAEILDYLVRHFSPDSGAPDQPESDGS